MIAISGETESGYPGEETWQGISSAGSMIKYYMGSCLKDSFPTQILSTILPMP